MSGAKPSARAETGLKPAKCGPTTADRGRHRGEPARPLVGQARESCPFTRKGRRITAQAKTRPSLNSGPGGDKQDEAVRPGDRPAGALGSDAPDRPAPQCGGRHRHEPNTPVGTCGVDPVQHQHMKVNVEVERTAPALDQRHRPGLRPAQFEPSTPRARQRSCRMAPTYNRTHASRIAGSTSRRRRQSRIRL